MESLDELLRSAFKSVDSVCEGLQKPTKLKESKLIEGCWSVPQTKKAAEKLKALLDKPLLAKDAPEKLYSLLGDDTLFDNLAGLNPEDDARQTVIDFINDQVLPYFDTYDVDWEDGVLTILNELSKKKLTEDLFDLSTEDGAKAAKEFKNTEDDKDPVTKIVDPAVTDEEDLKKNYIGDMILQCPTCHTLFYKSPEELKKVEDSGEGKDATYNEEDICPHCGTEGPFQLVGQVAAMDAEDKDPAEHDPNLPQDGEKKEPEVKPEEDKKEPEVKPEDKKPEDKKPEEGEGKEKKFKFNHEPQEKKDESGNIPAKKPAKESFELKDRVVDIDSASFDSLVNKFTRSIYENVEKYETTSGLINKDNKLVLEGLITFKSGKTTTTKFIFESKGMYKGKVKLVGMNETFSHNKRSPFVVYSRPEETNLICESLSFNYLATEEKIAKGTVTNK